MQYKNVTIVGGTHGNEPTGTYLLKKWDEYPESIQRATFQPRLFLANPRAVKAQRRYVGTDLNRAFGIEELGDPTKVLSEEVRAREIDRLLGPKLNNPQTDYLIDLHTTTSNMGTTIIIYESEESVRMAAYVTKMLPDVRIYMTNKKIEETVGLFSVAPNGVLIEVGPVPQNVLRHDVIEKTEIVVGVILDYLERVNRSQDLSLPDHIEVYQRGEAIDYPRNEKGELTGMVHKEFQDQDFKLLKKGTVLFHLPSGNEFCYDSDEEVYPVFINEAAYYEKGIAYRVTRKKTRKVVPRS